MITVRNQGMAQLCDYDAEWNRTFGAIRLWCGMEWGGVMRRRDDSVKPEKMKKEKHINTPDMVYFSA